MKPIGAPSLPLHAFSNVIASVCFVGESLSLFRPEFENSHKRDLGLYFELTTIQTCQKRRRLGCEIPRLGRVVSSRNLAFTFFDMSVLRTTASTVHMMGLDIGAITYFSYFKGTKLKLRRR